MNRLFQTVAVGVVLVLFWAAFSGLSVQGQSPMLPADFTVGQRVISPSAVTYRILEVQGEWIRVDTGSGRAPQRTSEPNQWIHVPTGQLWRFTQ